MRVREYKFFGEIVEGLLMSGFHEVQRLPKWVMRVANMGRESCRLGSYEGVRGDGVGAEPRRGKEGVNEIGH